ncbi:50S ribosomal protein L5 [Puniceicoccaceae bacterium K14]|nr:50S ribosomal protein L5 [Puniceicoccaceae bacterium K14]
MSSENRPYIKAHYEDVVVAGLKKQFGYKNKFEVPAISKVSLNAGVSAHFEKSVLEETFKNMAMIAGQQPAKTFAKKSIANFKLREGMPIGCKVTLRGNRMWDFMFRLIAISLPAIRDFRGIHDRMDGNGNYSLGIHDITIFPEINVESIKRQSGLELSIVTTAKTDKEGRELLKLLGMPFRKHESKEESSETAA